MGERGIFGLKLFITFLGLTVLLAQAQDPSVPWDQMKSAVPGLLHALETGNGAGAQVKVIQLQLFLAGAPQASKVGEQIVIVESQPNPRNNDPSLSRFVPIAARLSKAISDRDEKSASSFLQELSSDIMAARQLNARRVLMSSRGGDEYSADVKLEDELKAALCANSADKLRVLATQVQIMIDGRLSRHQEVLSYGYYFYLMNDARGRAAFLSGDYQAAGDFLQKAAEVPVGATGTLMLDDFGPNLWLARQLLMVGKSDVVLKFLQTSKERFWLHGSEKADPWIAAIEGGKTPDLMPNSALNYGCGAR